MTRLLGKQHITVDGKRLETLWIEPPHGDPQTIVMLHEGLGSVALWKDFPQRVAQATGCGVLAYSRYGYGKSDSWGGRPLTIDFMHHEAKVVLPQLLDQLAIHEPILLGHSDGGSIALIFAGTFPERPRALILEAPHVFVEDLTVASIRQAKHEYDTNHLRGRLGRYHADVESAFRAWTNAWLDPAFRNWNIEEYLPRISCPVLVIQGEQDEYGTTTQLDAIARQVPQARTVLLPDCRHSPHRDQPDATLAEIVKACAASRPRRG